MFREFKREGDTRGLLVPDDMLDDEFVAGIRGMGFEEVKGGNRHVLEKWTPVKYEGGEKTIEHFPMPLSFRGGPNGT